MRTGIILASLLAAILALPTIEARAADCSGGLDAKISAAKTAADHEAIAACYDDMVKDARAKVDEHKTMAKAYSMSGIGNQATKTHFHQHCEALIRSYEAEAKEYTALATAHRQMAKNAK
jgi:hypothetical protein